MTARSLLAALVLAAACAPASPVRAPSSAPAGGAAQPVSSELSPEARAWVDRTLASLSRSEKVGQLLMPWVGGDFVAVDSPEFDRLVEWVEEVEVGGLVMSVGLPHSYAAKLNELQRRADVPLLVTSDMENGPGMRMGGIFSFPHLLPQGGGTTFPPVMALGATGSDSLAFELGRVLGREARAVGVQMVFGPVLDVNSNPLNPIINTRSFGEDPRLVSRMGTAYIRGAHAAGLLTTAKHFPGHGDTETDSHIDLPRISADARRLDAVELVPFRAAVGAGVDAVMTAHIAVTGVEGPSAPPATLSPHFMTELLREEMGFRGLLFTDAMDMGAVAKRYGSGESLILALDAGADVLLMPRDVRAAHEAVLAALDEGRISEGRIDASVRRILEAKARAGLFRERLVDLEQVDDRVAVRAHTEVARGIAERSLTLVRDHRQLVPLPAGARRILSLTYAEPTDPVAGRVLNQALEEGGAEIVQARVDDRTSPAELHALRAQADSADVVIVSAFVSPREYKGSVDARSGAAELVERLSREGVPVIAVSFGSPYLLGRFPSVPAYLLAWGGAEVSQRAAARALLGEIPITGSLPISLPPHHRLGEGLRREARAETTR